ncbi:MAG: hypothetical protein M3N93_09350 [Acidobacteriota bacterium]|nr:hypothetical protein [Acidobacteriota bacterium]
MPWKITAEAIAVVLCAVTLLRPVSRGRRPTRVFAKKLEAFTRQKALVYIAAALIVAGIRAALLPVWPAPQPSIYDEFSYILQADTFAHARLANQPHALWPFFETVYVLQQPTYASKYPPGQGLAMAVGKLATGSPWAGVWLSCALLAAALCWALQGWLPSQWALLGTLIALDLCIFSYWMNSYWGGAVAAIGGALVVGSYGRILRRDSARSLPWVYGAGAAILLLTRPYEGFLLAAPVSIALWLQVKRRRSQIWLPIAAIVAAALAWTAFYDYRVTGHPLRMPYQEYFARYESYPPLIVLPVEHTKASQHFDLDFLNRGWTRDMNSKARSLHLSVIRLGDLYQTASTIFGDPLWLAALLLGTPLWLLSKRTRPLVLLAGVLILGAIPEMIFYVHYAAPFTAVLLILLVQSLRRTRAWAALHLPGGRPASRLALTILCWIVLGTGFASRALHVYRGDTPDRRQAVSSSKGAVEANLMASHPGKHVIFVRYTGIQSPHEEWIYNLADIDHQPVIWAQDMGAENSRLVAWYPDRSFWMFQPDIDPGYLQPYRNP